MNIQDTLNGAEALLEGFGVEPPSRDVAQSRADVCLHSGPNGGPCPHNHLGGWAITAKMGQIIQAQRERKFKLNLKVSGEDGLGICKICRCPLNLKVFYDWSTIYNHTSDETFQLFKTKWPACWMLTELTNHK